MTKAMKKFLHDITAETLGLPLNKVIWAYQNGMPKPKHPFVLVRSYGLKEEAQEEFRDTDKPNVKLVRVPMSENLEVQYFAGTNNDIDPVYELRQYLRKLEDPNVVDSFFVQKMAIFSYSEINDITTLLNNQVYERRAVVELKVRFNSEYETDLGAIEQVKIIQKRVPSLPGGQGNTSISGSGITISGSSSDFLSQNDVLIPTGDIPDGIAEGVERINALVNGRINKNGTVDDYTKAVLFDFIIRGED